MWFSIQKIINSKLHNSNFVCAHVCCLIFKRSICLNQFMYMFQLIYFIPDFFTFCTVMLYTDAPNWRTSNCPLFQSPERNASYLQVLNWRISESQYLSRTGFCSGNEKIYKIEFDLNHFSQWLFSFPLYFFFVELNVYFMRYLTNKLLFPIRSMARLHLIGIIVISLNRSSCFLVQWKKKRKKCTEAGQVGKA